MKNKVRDAKHLKQVNIFHAQNSGLAPRFLGISEALTACINQVIR
jgi:hypothetical protein